MAKKKAAKKAAKKVVNKLGVTTTQLALFGLMLVAALGLLMLNTNYPAYYSDYYMYAGIGLFALAVLYFMLIQKKA